MLGFLWTRQYQFSNKIELHQVLTESHEPNFSTSRALLLTQFGGQAIGPYPVGIRAWIRTNCIHTVMVVPKSWGTVYEAEASSWLRASSAIWEKVAGSSTATSANIFRSTAVPLSFNP